MRLIDADALMDDINYSINEMTKIRIAVDVNWLWEKLNDALDNAPTIEPERKTGHWLIRKFSDKARCSVCGRSFADVYDMENSDHYCRHCGSKMDGLRVKE